MNMTAALDITIGLVLMYLVLSLFCTTINEFIASLTRLRANSLKGALEELIDNPGLLSLFHNHGFIDGSKIATSGGVQKTTPAPAAGTPPVAPNPYPSYLPG
jgi:hypothetical protein